MLPLCLWRILRICGVSGETSPLSALWNNILPSHWFQHNLWTTEMSTVSGTSLKAPFMRSAVILTPDGLQSGPVFKASEEEKRLLHIASPALSNVKQEVTYTHAKSDSTLGQRGQPSKGRSWQASLSSFDCCHGTPHTSQIRAANALSTPTSLTSAGPS